MRGRLRALQAVDLVYSALAVALALTVALAVPSFLVGWDWAGVKYGLFVLGFLLFGYAVFRLRPVAPYADDKPSAAMGADEETRFQRAVNRLPPLRGNALPPDYRVKPAWKLFLGSLAALAVSMLLEFAFGVRI